MATEKKLLEALITINAISQEKGLGFQEKFQQILSLIVSYMQARSVSIMLVKGRRRLEVVASTDRAIIGMTHSMDEDSPSAWVVNENTPYPWKTLPRAIFFSKNWIITAAMPFFWSPSWGRKGPLA